MGFNDLNAEKKKNVMWNDTKKAFKRTEYTQNFVYRIHSVILK